MTISLRRKAPAPKEGTLATSYEALSFPFTVRSPSAEIQSAVDFVYGQMRKSVAPAEAFPIEIRQDGARPERMELFMAGEKRLEVESLGDLLHGLDNELTIVLEQAVPRLYFVHAAAVAEQNRATLLVGDSGAGKSTTTYALAASGSSYLSDELAPIDPATGEVHTYPRAICLKNDPPQPLTLPERHLRTEWTIHISPRDLGAPVMFSPVPLERVVFVKYSPEGPASSLRPISKGEGAVKLYKCALNQLAHPNFGLDDTLSLIRRAECFELMARGVKETVEALRRPRPPGE